MADNKKLMEAAYMIKEHCNHTEKGGPCQFAHGGVCNGVEHCRLSEEGGIIPGTDWDLQKPRRWTDADINLAKALRSFGVTKIKKTNILTELRLIATQSVQISTFYLWTRSEL